MYQVQDSSALVSGHRALLRPRAHGLRVPRTVVLLGFTSLLTDISSEMVAAVPDGFMSMWKPVDDPAFPWTGIVFGAPTSPPKSFWLMFVSTHRMRPAELLWQRGLSAGGQ